MSNENDDEFYDEFGNYVGPELDSSSGSEDEDDSDDEPQQQNIPDDASDVSGDNALALASGTPQVDVMADPQNAIVLHEDKEHYASATETFGEDVRIAVLEEDAMDLDTPIVEPVVQKAHAAVQDHASLQYKYKDEFLTQVLLSNETTSTRRSIAICGHLHHGKTTLVDALVEPTLQTPFGPKVSLEDQGLRLSDTLQAEQDRQLSIKSTPWTMALSDTRGKSYAITLVDCPGHVQFHDESVASMKIVDGVLLVVDCVEGVMMHTELLIQQAVVEGLPILLCLSKMDKLIVELKLPPRDAYYKLLHIIETVNDCIAKASCQRYPVAISPDNGNVCFSSALHGWIFTLESFAQLYADHHDDTLGNNLTIEQFAKRLWGDWYWDAPTRQFFQSTKNCSNPSTTQRTFITFILEPIYKIYTACLGESDDNVNGLLRSLGVLLKKEELQASARPLLRCAMSKFLATAAGGVVDMIVKNVATPKNAAKGKVLRGYSGPMDAPIVQDLMSCRSQGKLVIHVTKLYSTTDGSAFDAFGRIYSGTIRPGQRIKVLGEAYVPEVDEEDCAIATVEGVAIPRGREQIAVTVATAGNWVFLKGIDDTIAKTATIVGLDQDEQSPVSESGESEVEGIHTFKQLRFPFCGGESIVKISLEPCQPAELPKMVEGLRRVSKSYPMVHSKVEESGEHVLFGTGELYLDCVLHDLRSVHADVEVKVADPIVAFRETVVETSSLKCFGEVRLMIQVHNTGSYVTIFL
jgi:116 kDa U5 small nuclear ribonucleoprotein component